MNNAFDPETIRADRAGARRERIRQHDDGVLDSMREQRLWRVTFDDPGATAMRNVLATCADAARLAAEGMAYTATGRLYRAVRAEVDCDE